MDEQTQKRNEQMIERYTGLNIYQLEALLKAARGTLETVSGSRKKALAELIDGDLRATPRGLELLKFAEHLAENDYYLGPRNATKEPLNWVPIIKQANADLPSIYAWRPSWIKDWFTHAHLRVMCQLYDYGCVSLRWLNKTFGGKTVSDLEKAGMVQFGAVVWPIYSLTPAGVESLQDWGLI